MEPDRDPFLRFSDVRDPKLQQRVEDLRIMWSAADEIEASAKQRSKQLRDRVRLGLRQVGQSRVTARSELKNMRQSILIDE